MAEGEASEVLGETTRVTLRRLAASDRQEFVKLVKASREILYPWVFLPGTHEEFDKYIQRFDGMKAECLLICVRGTGEIAGSVSVSGIQREPYHRATVGYNAFEPYVRHGYMSEGMRLVFRFAFEDLKLHRLEADIQPNNKASLAFASNVGFQREGYSPDFIFIEGEWRDHERWAILNSGVPGL